MKLIRAIIILFTKMKHIISLEKPVEISSFKPQLVFLLKFKKVYHNKGQKSLTDSIDFHIHLAVIARSIIYFDTKTENKLVNSTQLCMYLVCIHTILTKTKIIFIAVNTSRRGGKTTSHVFVLNITFMIGPVQNMCVCVCAKYDTTKAIMGEVLTEHFSTIFVHTFWEIGGVLFWRGDIFSSQLGSF